MSEFHRCTVNKSVRSISPNWTKPVEEGIGFEAGILLASPHPVVPNGALILVGTSEGTLGVWEAGGKLQPHVVGTHHLPDQPEVCDGVLVMQAELPSCPAKTVHGIC